MGMIKLLRQARKKRKKQNKEEQRKKVPSVQSPGGAWFDAENLADVHNIKVVDSMFKSTRSIESDSTYNTAASFLSSTDNNTSTCSVWTSSGDKDHHKGSPLIARRHCNSDISNSNSSSSDNKSKRNLMKQKSSRLNKIEDEPAELGLIMARSRKLPKHSWYYANNHIQVNNERTKRTIAPLLRHPILDEAAREHARLMAQQADDQLRSNENVEEDQSEIAAFHSDPWELRSKLFHRELKHQKQEQEQTNKENIEEENTTYRICTSLDNDYHHFHRVGENVAVGNSIKEIHLAMMSDSIADKNNILDRRYIYLGMGTAKSEVTGKLYLCQIFQG